MVFFWPIPFDTHTKSSWSRVIKRNFKCQEFPGAIRCENKLLFLCFLSGRLTWDYRRAFLFGNSLRSTAISIKKSAFKYNATIFSTVIIWRNMHKYCIFNHLQLTPRFRNILCLCLSASLSSKIIESHVITECAINTDSQVRYLTSQKCCIRNIFWFANLQNF